MRKPFRLHGFMPGPFESVFLCDNELWKGEFFLLDFFSTLFNPASRPSDSTVSEDAAIEPRAAAPLVFSTDALSTRLVLIYCIHG